MVDVRDPEGVPWSVERRWLPWKPRRRRITRGDVAEHGLDLVDVGDGFAGLAVGLVVLVVLVALPIIVVLAVLLAEVLVLLAVVPLIMLARAVLVGGWRIDVRRYGTPRYATSVRGWRRSQERIAALAAAVEAGRIDDEVRDASRGTHRRP